MCRTDISAEAFHHDPFTHRGPYAALTVTAVSVALASAAQRKSFCTMHDRGRLWSFPAIQRFTAVSQLALGIPVHLWPLPPCNAGCKARHAK